MRMMQRDKDATFAIGRDLNRSVENRRPGRSGLGLARLQSLIVGKQRGVASHGVLVRPGRTLTSATRLAAGSMTSHNRPARLLY